jgi:hypothetical protein
MASSAAGALGDVALGDVALGDGLVDGLFVIEGLR